MQQFHAAPWREKKGRRTLNRALSQRCNSAKKDVTTVLSATPHPAQNQVTGRTHSIPKGNRNTVSERWLHHEILQQLRAFPTQPSPPRRSAGRRDAGPTASQTPRTSFFLHVVQKGPTSQSPRGNFCLYQREEYSEVLSKEEQQAEYPQ